ncbi:hypothetical protein SCG7086_CI_00060 [Chlamydiales bacterium SCGC AG-110-P3]|nr:hypothetical protein SCG7086_CI_00060 [Chlamydiales bacterium SCGC AG-110-P3]
MFNNYVFERMAQSYASTRIENVHQVHYQAMQDAAFEEEFQRMNSDDGDLEVEYPCE